MILGVHKLLVLKLIIKNGKHRQDDVSVKATQIKKREIIRIQKETNNYFNQDR